MASWHEPFGWTGHRVVAECGGKAGAVVEVCRDPDGEPAWLLVRVGRFAGVHTFVPAAGAVAARGCLWVPHRLDLMLAAAPLAAARELTPRVELELRLHYALRRRSFQPFAASARDGSPPFVNP